MKLVRDIRRTGDYHKPPQLELLDSKELRAYLKRHLVEWYRVS